MKQNKELTEEGEREKEKEQEPPFLISTKEVMGELKWELDWGEIEEKAEKGRWKLDDWYKRLREDEEVEGGLR